jgi:glycosyltransferase 2 family protein
MRRALSKAGPALKVLFGVGIFAWMAASGKLNFAQIAKGLAHWPLMLAILALGYCQIGICVWRWTMLLHAQDIPLSFRRAWGLTMIGVLFNVVIPGAVGGDLIKGYYITRATGGRKTHAATSIAMDRVVGLIGLLFLSAAVVLANTREILHNPAMRTLGALTVAGFAGGLVGLYAAVFAGERLSRWSFLPRMLRDVFEALHEYRQQPAVVRKALALSVLNQTITCSSYYLALRSTGVTGLRMSQFFLIVPLGIVTTAVPISPAGIGVGQAAFFALFTIVAPSYASAGTDAFTVYQAMFILLCLSGLFWYVAYKHADLAPATPPQP